MPTGVSFETKTVNLERFARNVFINDRDVREYRAGSGFDLRQPALDALAHKILGVHAHKVFQGIYSTASSYGDGSGSGAGSHVVDGPDLNTTTVDIVDPILTGCQEIYDAEGRYPTHASHQPDRRKLASLERRRARAPESGRRRRDARDGRRSRRVLRADVQRRTGRRAGDPQGVRRDDGRFMGDHIALAFLDFLDGRPDLRWRPSSSRARTRRARARRSRESARRTRPARGQDHRRCDVSRPSRELRRGLA